MNKFLKAATAIIIALAITAIMIVTANAESRYIEKSFTFGSYAPTVIIHHPAYNWVLEAKPDGSFSWAKPNGSNAQLFVILPTSYAGYYSFREFNNGGYQQRYITYTPSGFRLEYAADAKAAVRAFKFAWKNSDKCGGKTLKNVWRFTCKQNNVNLCAGGWGCVRIEQTNAG